MLAADPSVETAASIATRWGYTNPALRAHTPTDTAKHPRRPCIGSRHEKRRLASCPDRRRLAGRWRSGDPWRADLPGNPREYLGKRDLCVRPVVVAGACHYDARYPRRRCRLTQPPGRQRAGELLLSRSDFCRGRDTEPPCDAVIRGMRAHRSQCVEHLPLLLVTGVKPLHRLLFGTGIRGSSPCPPAFASDRCRAQRNICQQRAAISASEGAPPGPALRGGRAGGRPSVRYRCARTALPPAGHGRTS